MPFHCHLALETLCLRGSFNAGKKCMSNENEQPSAWTKITLEQTSWDVLSHTDILSHYFSCQIAFTPQPRNTIRHLLYACVNLHEFRLHSKDNVVTVALRAIRSYTQIPLRTVSLEKSVSAPVVNNTVFYGTRRFVSELTQHRLWHIFWEEYI
jgi:hypothetical protein